MGLLRVGGVPRTRNDAMGGRQGAVRRYRAQGTFRVLV